MTAQFRIGGHYKQKDGRVVELAEFKYGNEPGTGWARMPDNSGDGFRRLIDGRDTKEHFGAQRDLLPGELTLKDGQWVPVAEEAPKTAITPSSIPGYGFDAAGHVVRTTVPERVRPPLTWATPKQFDAFKGFFTEPADIADWQDTYFPR